MRIMLMVGLLLSWVELLPAQENFDRLGDADRAAFQKEFEKQIWPLLSRNGKDGCVGCHTKGNGALRFSDDPGKDFARLLKDGFFLVNDSGSLLERIKAKTPNRRMPPGSRPAWTADEITRLRDFMDAVEKKQKRSN